MLLLMGIKVKDVSGVFVMAAVGLIVGAVGGYFLSAVTFSLIGNNMRASNPNAVLDLGLMSIGFWLLCAVAGGVGGAVWGVASYSRNRNRAKVE